METKQFFIFYKRKPYINPHYRPRVANYAAIAVACGIAAVLLGALAAAVWVLFVVYTGPSARHAHVGVATTIMMMGLAWWVLAFIKDVLEWLPKLETALEDWVDKLHTRIRDDAYDERETDGIA